MFPNGRPATMGPGQMYPPMSGGYAPNPAMQGMQSMPQGAQALPPINLMLSKEEETAYEKMFKDADATGTGYIQGLQAVSYFSKTGLPKQGLSKIWAISDRQRRGFLDKDGFFLALRLIAITQKGSEPSIEILGNFRGIKLIPTFEDLKDEDKLLQHHVALRRNSGHQVGPASASPGAMPPAMPPAAMNPAMSMSFGGSDAMGGFGAPSPMGAVGGMTGGDIWEVKDHERSTYHQEFKKLSNPANPFITGPQAVSYFTQLPKDVLGKIWVLSDVDNDRMLSAGEFVIFSHIVTRLLTQAQVVPASLPHALMKEVQPEIDELLRTSSVPPPT
eukprot:TRINITY_DN2712_c0_g1::TRINITY_DN2712_c0_g1_i1::g.27818::m.27818 TRINITY_DN2712_c0_g1::TRINITY_DN2712_c0_g1_i1::g.27818  ORF type:complete len:331 (+),score=40.98,sp/Q9HGL2/YHLA_SCHPO/29.18/3e-18,sp/Q9HGL2/YHLA_SCHPO/29.29/2e-08,sp/Q9HGL2/YHLA_SCHPO/33.33/7e-07,EF-hand_4/PF12763.2/8.6e-05,EF-hand_4/PF12763.2/6.5e-12,EF-hand_1/PF00036.27/1.2,EF-hand_1/PF00036.27/71,EF-hand_1/PF00036.27/6.9,EF-hand_7/PF13499.1/30,EF-hand_7/PF13499.1/1.8,EF-hand_7/PF13499.1/21,EF-hand_7/PF13499.1/97 TRINITY_DN2712_c